MKATRIFLIAAIAAMLGTAYSCSSDSSDEPEIASEDSLVCGGNYIFKFGIQGYYTISPADTFVGRDAQDFVLNVTVEHPIGGASTAHKNDWLMGKIEASIQGYGSKSLASRTTSDERAAKWVKFEKVAVGTDSALRVILTPNNAFLKRVIKFTIHQTDLTRFPGKAVPLYGTATIIQDGQHNK